METRTFYIDEIHSGCCERGVFRFLYMGQLVEFFYKQYPPNEQYEWPHHLEYPDIINLNKEFPEEIPLCMQNFNLTSWGERVKYGLYSLVERGVFDKTISENGMSIIKYKWAAPPIQKKPISIIKRPRTRPAGLR